MKKIFVLQKKCVRLLLFSYSSKTSRYIKFTILKIIYFYFNDQLPLQVKNIFIKNESVNPYNTNINTTHFGTKSLRYNGPSTWNNSQSMNNNNLFNVVISEFKNFLKD